MAGEIMDDYCRGRMPESEFWRRTCARNGWQGDTRAAGRALRENMHEMIPGTRKVLEDLCAAGHEPYLLSDHGREWIDHLLGVHSFFEVFERRFWSFELGSIKRERATFEKVLAELGSPPPQEVVFVDDAAPNIEVARSTGIDAILFTGAEQLRAELRRRQLI
jgi:2-haloacid dehalogenase